MIWGTRTGPGVAGGRALHLPRPQPPWSSDNTTEGPSWVLVCLVHVSPAHLHNAERVGLRLGPQWATWLEFYPNILFSSNIFNS